MSNITNAAVSSINDQRHLEAQEKARKLVVLIVQSNTSITARKEALDKLQGELRKLAHEKYNVVEITGSMPSGENATTITDTIAQLNKDEQSRVACRCTELDAAIRREQALLDSETFNRAELRKKLAEIKVEEVTVASIS